MPPLPCWWGFQGNRKKAANLDMRVHSFLIQNTNAKTTERMLHRPGTQHMFLTWLLSLSSCWPLTQELLPCLHRMRKSLPISHPLICFSASEKRQWLGPTVRLTFQRSLLMGGQVLSLSGAAYQNKTKQTLSKSITSLLTDTFLPAFTWWDEVQVTKMPLPTSES